MIENDVGPKSTFQVFPIGYIHRTESEITLEILPPFRPGLKQLDHFSHVIVLWWADRHDNEKSRNILQTEPPYAEGKVTGGLRLPLRIPPQPNRIIDM